MKQRSFWNNSDIQNSARPAAAASSISDLWGERFQFLAHVQDLSVLRLSQRLSVPWKFPTWLQHNCHRHCCSSNICTTSNSRWVWSSCCVKFLSSFHFLTLLNSFKVNVAQQWHKKHLNFPVCLSESDFFKRHYIRKLPDRDIKGFGWLSETFLIKQTTIIKLLRSLRRRIPEQTSCFEQGSDRAEGSLLSPL